jgi:hypothetical protein
MVATAASCPEWKAAVLNGRTKPGQTRKPSSRRISTLRQRSNAEPCRCFTVIKLAKTIMPPSSRRSNPRSTVPDLVGSHQSESEVAAMMPEQHAVLEAATARKSGKKKVTETRAPTERKKLFSVLVREDCLAQPRISSGATYGKFHEPYFMTSRQISISLSSTHPRFRSSGQVKFAPAPKTRYFLPPASYALNED